MIYSIYTLSNPVTDEIFYVGCTTNIKERAKQHGYLTARSKVKQGTKVTNKDLYIVQLMQDPICHVIEEMTADETAARKRENFWIVFMIECGFPLVNMISKASLKEPVTVGDLLNALRTIEIITPVKIAA